MGSGYGNCCRRAIVAATINNNAMWQPTARISCKNLFMTLCCRCAGPLCTILASLPTPSTPPQPLCHGPHFALFWAPACWQCCCWCCSCNIAHLPLIYGTLIGQTIIGHISSHFLPPLPTCGHLPQNVARISLGSSCPCRSLIHCLPLALSHSSSCMQIIFAATHHFSARFSASR